MRALAEYIISVSAAAFLCGILNSMMLKGTAKEVMKLVSGLFLAFCVISPVSDLRLPELTDLGESLQQEAQEAAAAGESMAQESVSESIKEQLEAYILDKAESLGLNLTVEVFLAEEDSFLPEGVTLQGDAPLPERQELIQEITDALGLTEEDITWTRRS